MDRQSEMILFSPQSSLIIDDLKLKESKNAENLKYHNDESCQIREPYNQDLSQPTFAFRNMNTSFEGVTRIPVVTKDEGIEESQIFSDTQEIVSRGESEHDDLLEVSNPENLNSCLYTSNELDDHSLSPCLHSIRKKNQRCYSQRTSIQGFDSFSLANQQQQSDIQLSNQFNGPMMTTPTLAIAFSPFLSFSDDRFSGSSIVNEMIPESDRASKTESDDIIPYLSSNVDESDGQIDYHESHQELLGHETPYENRMLTYADSLLLNAAKFRKSANFHPPKKTTSASTTKSTNRKRKTESSDRTDRQPQRRYSIDMRSNDIPGSDLFGSKRDGRIRLTTNIPREVEALDPLTGNRVHLFSSCSEASRVMNINRTRMSRTCRAGGGHIGDYIYQYVEMSDQSTDTSNNSITPSESASIPSVDQTVVAAASALLLL